MNLRTLRFRTAATALALGVLAVLAMPRLSVAQDPGPVYLRGNSQLQDDRVQLLREELAERKNELKERAERARHAKQGKHPRGEKVQYVPGSDDRSAAGAAAARVADPFGLNRTFVAPTNTKTNDKTGDGATDGQAEQSIAFLGQNGLCAWNDGHGFDFTPISDVQGFGWTVNGGATWTDGGTPLKQGTIATWSSDPVVSVNEKTGDFYYCGLTTNTGTNNNGVGVLRGHFAGGTFVQDAATMVVAGPSSSQFFDKQWMAADSLNGNLYVTWTLFVPGGDAIFFSRSTDNGASWGPPIQISGSWENGRVSGSRPQVGPNGEVYVTYSAIGPVDADSIKVAKSTNGGTSFDPSIVATTIYDNFFDGAPGFNRPRAVTFPSIAVDRSTGPNRGRVYLTIHDCVNFYGDPLFINSGISEVENNGGFANATPFTVGQTLRGSISAATDQDWFKFPATQGTTYIFFVDSLRTSGLRYTMRLYCPNDTTVLSRIAFSGAQSNTSALNSHSLIVWTAPTTNTYFLRMIPVTVGAGANPYRIISGTHIPVGSDVARDTRDVVMTSSADGQTGWAPRKIVNDDLALYDNWLPEVAVPCDGNPYIMWFDWRDAAASCFGGSNIYVSRSTNGGATWSASQVATTAPTPNWTQVISNIAPNQGDYNGMYGGDAVGLAFADGRLGDADVFAAKIDCKPIVLCLNDTTVLANTTYNTTFNITNPNQMFPNDAIVSVSADRNWPGVPVSGGVGTVPSLSQIAVPFSLNIPDTAATGDVRFCFTVSWAGGACSQTCCATLHVLNPATATLASLIDASADGGVVKLSWQMATTGEVRLYRSTDGTAWSFINMLVPDGSQRVSYEDGTVTRGARYWYRLGIVQPGGEMPAGEVSVNVPLTAEFAMYGARPNPSFGRLTLSFSLASSAPARLEIVDLGGRRVFEREVGSMGAGFHVLPIGQERSLPIGVYVVRLSQGGRVVTNKATVIR
jgi:hypothetical protein